MKKIISTFLILTTVVSLCACNSGSSSGETPQQQSDATDTPSEITTEVTTSQQSDAADEQNIITTETEAEKEFQTVNFGDTITLDFAEITINEFGYGNGIVEEDGNNKSSFNEGHYMAYIKGTIKNTYSTYIDPSPSNSYVTMIFDDKYTYTGSIQAMASSFDGVPALETCGFYVYADVSEEIIDSFTTVKIIFGFTENFESPEIYSFKDFEKCDYLYQLEATK